MPIPVYLFTGFLESGKTKFVQETFEDPRFEDGLRALLLVCEEGEEEYEPSRFAVKNCRVEYISSEEELTRARLMQITADFRPEKIVIECNGMWPLGRLYEALPEDWAEFAPLATSPHEVPAADIAANRSDWIDTWTATVLP